MATQYAFGKIVTNGLVLSLDAADKNSYPGSGATWNDLTQNLYTASLVNTPTFLNTNGGTLEFRDSSFQYGDTNKNIGGLTNWTVEAWTRIGASLTGKVTTIVCNQYDLVSNLNFSIGTNNAPITYNLVVGFFNGAWRNTTGHVPPLNTWFQVVGTYDGNTINQYHNGSLTSSLSYTGTSTSGGTIRLARRWDDVANIQSNMYSGSVSIVRIYNRSLTNSEIQQNYNAQKSRFGLT